MEIKKSPQADLERSKGLSLLLGLVVALSVVFVALEYRSKVQKAELSSQYDAAMVDDALLIADQQEEPEPEQPQPEQQVEAQLPDDFKVVEDNKEVAKIAFVSADEKKELPPPAPVGPVVVEEEEADHVFEVVEEPTEFPGGSAAMMKWLKDNIVYPDIAQENNIQGRVYVSFVIERDGSPTNVQVARGVDPALDREAVRVVGRMPKWKPGKQRGKPVRQKFTIPVLFRLQQ